MAEHRTSETDIENGSGRKQPIILVGKGARQRMFCRVGRAREYDVADGEPAAHRSGAKGQPFGRRGRGAGANVNANRWERRKKTDGVTKMLPSGIAARFLRRDEYGGKRVWDAWQRKHLTSLRTRRKAMTLAGVT
jgi:hypothetical protein